MGSLKLSLGGLDGGVGDRSRQTRGSACPSPRCSGVGLPLLSEAASGPLQVLVLPLLSASVLLFTPFQVFVSEFLFLP